MTLELRSSLKEATMGSGSEEPVTLDTFHKNATESVQELIARRTATTEAWMKDTQQWHVRTQKSTRILTGAPADW